MHPVAKVMPRNSIVWRGPEVFSSDRGLRQFTSGLPRYLVHCVHMDVNRGYIEAKHLLKEHFGNEIKISGAYLEKALNWTAIKAEDGKMLHAYAMYLTGCCNVMQDLQYMDELDIPSNLRLICVKTTLQASGKVVNSSL